ncbi:MAG: glycosyltransferase [Actinomycetota bacterium]|nr:glycosyltransferase [Actinomycetota bacterium]
MGNIAHAQSADPDRLLTGSQGASAPIGFAVAGNPLDVATHSGVPFALLDAFAQLGAPVRPLRAALPDPLQRLALNLMAVTVTRRSDIPLDGSSIERLVLAVRGNKPRVHAGRWMAALRSGAVAARLVPDRDLRQCVQFGSEYRLPARVRYVTYDDATIVQLSRAYPYPWMRSVPADELDRMIARQQRIFAGAECCCLSNHWAAVSATEDYGVPPERIVVTGEGATPVVPLPERDWSAPRFLFVGKEWERKNGAGLLRAFARVFEQRPEAQLDVVGGHPRLDEPGVVGHGFLPAGDPAAQARLHELFARATCLVVPSLLEPGGCVFAQALQAGLPSIGGAAGGAATIIGDAGLLVDGSDERALLTAMLELCDERSLQSFAAAARSRAALFTWRAVAERVLRALAPANVDVGGFAVPL